MQNDTETENCETHLAASQPAKRVWFAVLSLLVAPGLILWAVFNEAYFRHWIYAAAPVFSLFLVALWWSLLIENPWAKKRRRLVIVFGLATGFGLLVAILVRPDGSHDGSSLPRLTWRWSSHSEKAALESLPLPVASFSAIEDQAEKLTTPIPGAADCATFLGPTRDGRIAHVVISPDWKENPPELLWKQPIGQGWASFAVVGHRAITLEQRKDDECASCYHLTTGEILWHQVWKGEHFSETMGGDGPRSTPSIHGNKVFTLGATGILACLRVEDGSLLWQRNILQDAQAPNLSWATTSSPLLAGSLVIVAGGDKTGPELLAYRQEDGEEVWRSGSNGGAYSSPRLVTLAGEQCILGIHSAGVAAYHPMTGKKLWDYPWGNSMPKVGQPHVLEGDRVLVTASYNQGSHLIQITRQADGTLVPAVIWESSRMKTKFSSSSVIGDHIYGLDEGRFACIEIATGDRSWKDGRYGFGQQLHVGNHLLVASERGSLVLIDPSPDELRELGTLKVFDDKCWAAPTLAGTYCLLRSEDEVACFLLPGKLVFP